MFACAREGSLCAAFRTRVMSLMKGKFDSHVQNRVSGRSRRRSSGCRRVNLQSSCCRLLDLAFRDWDWSFDDVDGDDDDDDDGDVFDF